MHEAVLVHDQDVAALEHEGDLGRQPVYLPSGHISLTRGSVRGTGALTGPGVRSVPGRWRATAARRGTDSWQPGRGALADGWRTYPIGERAAWRAPGQFPGTGEQTPAHALARLLVAAGPVAGVRLARFCSIFRYCGRGLPEYADSSLSQNTLTTR